MPITKVPAVKGSGHQDCDFARAISNISMNLKRSFSYSRSPALLALEHLALAVHGHVLPQVGVGGERLVALGAGERLDLLVNPERETTLSTHSAPECQKGFFLPSFESLTCLRGCAC